ncbi:MAG TPA: hypothetical protein VFM93_10425 [Candidatus Limnocylindria bacterium]|nr:hypothetical protein [Candidatus Limnocylindria bacterium]
MANAGLAILLFLLGLGAPLPSVPAQAACASSTGPGIPPPASVRAGIPGLHAQWYGQSGYMRLCPGERRTAVVAYYNAGSIGWVQGRMGEAAYLGTWAEEPGQDQPSVLGGDGTRGSPATGWPRYDRVAAQPAAYVGPGQVAWFQFTVQAPATPGLYRIGIRPVIEDASWLEDVGVYWEVTVLRPDGTAPPRPAPRDPLGFTVVAGPGLDAWHVHELHEGVARAGRHLAETYGGDRRRAAAATIAVGSGSERYCCLATGTSFEIWTSHAAWRAPAAAAPDTWSASVERMELSAHEYAHLWQHEVGGSGCMLGPRWLSEGMPETIAYGALVTDGLIQRRAVDTFLRRQLTGGEYVPLSSLESSWPASANPFAVGQLAVELLARERGALSLRDWCARVGRGEPWRAAFAGAFAEGVDAFYARFEAHRSAFVRSAP